MVERVFHGYIKAITFHSYLNLLNISKTY